MRHAAGGGIIRKQRRRRVTNYALLFHFVSTPSFFPIYLEVKCFDCNCPVVIMATSYRRVPQEENGSNESLEAHVTRSRGERLQDKLIALAWVFLAVIVAKSTSFLSTLWSSQDANRTLLRISGAGTLAVLGMILYLTVYLPRVKGLVDSSAWSVYCPKILPTMAAVGLTSYLIFLRATWPVWGFLAPLISGTQFM